MDVLDLQGKITLDTTEYEAAVQRAVTMGNQLSTGLQNAANVGAVQLQTSINNVGQSAGQMGTAVDQAANAANNLGQSTGAANGNVGQLGQSINTADQQSSNFANTIQNAVSVALGNLFTSAITKAKDALVDFAKQSINAGMDFDSAMSQVAATMGVSTDEITELRDYAKEMGATTAFSASQSAEALNYMALAGYDAEKSMEMLPNVLQLAASGSMELGRASDMVTDAQSALGLSMDETAEMVNKMAMAASKSNTSVEQLGDAMLQIGGTAKKLKGGTTELATILGILADNGMKGAEGGTHLRNMMNSLMSPTKDATEMMENLNVSLYDSEGNMRSFNDVFIDLRNAMDDMATQKERDKVISTIFNARDMKAAEAMLANVGDRYNELSGYIDQAAGSAQKMANTQLDNLKGDMTLFKSAVEGAQIAVSEKLEPVLRKVTKVGAQAVSEIAQAFGEHGLGAAIDAAKKAIWDGFGEKTARAIYAVEAATKAALAAFITYKATVVAAKITGFFTDAATGAVSLATGIGKINSALSALNINPVIAIGTAIAAAGVAMGSYMNSLTAAIEMPKNAYDELNDEQKETIDQIKAITSAMEESREESKKNAEEVEKQSQYYDRLKDKLFALDEAEELSTEDKAQMKAIVDELNNSVEGLNITLDAETGHLKTEKKAIEDTINAMKQKAKQAVAEKKLMEIYEKQADLEEALEKANRGRADAANTLMEKQRALSEATREYNELNEVLNRTGGGTAKDREAAQAAWESMQRLKEETAEASDQLLAWRETYTEAHAQVRKNGEEEKKIFDDLGLSMSEVVNKTEESTEALKAQAEAIEKTGDVQLVATRVIKDAETEQSTVYANLRGKTVAWSEETVKSVAAVIDEYIEYRKEVENSIKGSVDIFSQYEEKSSESFDTLMSNMRSNIMGVTQWTENIKKLRKDGMLPDELIDQWEEMGLASQGYVETLANATPEMQKQFAELWEQTNLTLNNAVHQAVKDDKKAYDEMLEMYTGQTEVKLGELKKLLDSFVTGQSEGYVKAVEDALKAADAINSAAENTEAMTFGVLGAVAGAGGAYEPVTYNGKTAFRVTDSGTGTANDTTTTVIFQIDGDTIVQKTINKTDYELGKQAELRARGYA